MKFLAGAVLTAVSFCLVAASANTAETKRPNGGVRLFFGDQSTQAPYMAGELLVKFLDDASPAMIASAHSAAGGHTHKILSIGQARLHRLKLDSGILVEDALIKYRQHPSVQYAEPNYLYQTTMIPNDTAFSSLWGLRNTGQAVNGTAGTPGVDIEATGAWDVTTGSPNVIIGVVDSGIAYDHPDLAPNMWVNTGEVPNDGIDNDGNGFVDDVNGYDFFNDDPDPMDPTFSPGGNPGHGTHVAGTIAALGNNGLGVTGVMYAAKLMALKAGDVNTALTSAAILQAEDYAKANSARVINASFGRSGGPCSQAEYDALGSLNAAGVVVVVAAGNQNSNNDVTPNYPAQYSVATACGPGLPNIIVVAAIDQNGNRASFSNFGAASVHIAAPGVSVYSAKPTSGVTSALFHSFDSNPAGLGYTSSGTNNSWGFTNTVSLSPPASLTDSPFGNYLNNTNSFVTSPLFSTVGQRGCRFVGAFRLATEPGFDWFTFEISRDGGATWSILTEASGSTAGAFVNASVSDIPDRIGNARFRFNFASDASVTDDGGYFDNLNVQCTSGTPSGSTDYQFISGTSMAAPHVTGVVGLVLAANPALTVGQIRNAILNTGVPSASLNGIVSSGRRLNARNAVISVVSNFTVTVALAGSGTGAVTSTPSGIDCGSMCSRAFPSPGTVTLSAVPSAGSTFGGWAGGGCTGTGTCVLTATANVTATFDGGSPSANGGNGGDGGGCTVAKAGTSDLLMPMLFAAAVGLVVWRIRRRSR